MTKRIEKLVKIIVDILTGIVLFAILFLLYGKIEMQISGNNYSNYFGYTLFKVTTGSMGNAVKIDDVVIVKIGDDFKENDIITYYEDKSFITHRVVEVDNNFLITKGDANNSEDSPISKNQVIGPVVYIISGLGIWQKVFSTPQILISIFVTLLLFDFAFSFKSKKELEKTKKLELDKIRDMSNTQIFKIDEIIKETKKERNLNPEPNDNIVEIDEQEIVEMINENNKSKTTYMTDKTEILDDLVEEIEELLTEEANTKNVIKENKEEIELLTTQVIPVDEIKKQETL